MPSDRRVDIAVLFDLDGVIVDSREHHLAAWHQLAREFALAHEPDYFTKTFGLRNDPILRGIVPDAPRVLLDEMALRKEELFRAAARGHLEMLPGVPGLLDLLDEQSVPKAIVTSAPRLNLDMMLETLGIADRFDALVSEEDAERGKPDPQGFLVAAERLGFAPEHSVVIEDAPAGLEAAKRGGMRAIGVTTTHPAAALGDADLVVDTLSDGRVRTLILG